MLDRLAAALVLVVITITAALTNPTVESGYPGPATEVVGYPAPEEAVPSATPYPLPTLTPTATPAPCLSLQELGTMEEAPVSGTLCP